MVSVSVTLAEDNTGASLLPVMVMVTVCTAEAALAAPLSSVATTAYEKLMVSPAPRKSRF
ncbi:hypothetical protein D3C81_2067430 [compost metagenome]